MALRFTLADLESAQDTWRPNCGPAALAAIAGLTLDEVRVHFGPNWPGYTNLSAMTAALRSVGRPFRVRRLDTPFSGPDWPRHGLARIQFEGPWTAPGANPRWASTHTHWVGAGPLYSMAGTPMPGETCIWDVNQLGPPLHGDGWSSVAWWTHMVVPRLVADIPRASGGGHVTHAIEVEP